MVALVAAAVYGVVWLVLMLRMRRTAEAARRAPLAPDDDPEFLARVEWQLAQERRRRAASASDSASGPSAPGEEPSGAQAAEPPAPGDEPPSPGTTRS